ncbi:hypothetical protein SBC1_24820 [Caballeronia sp. SBC1]|nr:hypothetical protein SBC1_24820 [Caballeronia sp. SBC1]
MCKQLSTGAEISNVNKSISLHSNPLSMLASGASKRPNKSAPNRGPDHGYGQGFSPAPLSVKHSYQGNGPFCG